MAGYGLMRAGFKWEPRRSGDVQLGLWRMKLSSGGTGQDWRRIVLVPGFGDTPLSWLTVLGLLGVTLKRQYDELILIDFPGFGGYLSHEQAFHSLESMKSSLFDTFDSLKPDTLIGHSLGGYLSALYAIECGEGLRPRAGKYTGPAKLLLIAPSGMFADPKDREVLVEKYQRAFEAKEEGLRFVRSDIFAKEPIWFRWIAPEFSAFFGKKDISQFAASMKAQSELGDRLQKIQGQVSLIWGEHDSLIVTRSMGAWSAKLPQATAELVPGAGHSPQIEKPRALAALLNKALG
jgi:pimeloyl-ACP methyl ester carboxylesterase